MSSEGPGQADGTWAHDFGDLGERGSVAAAEMAELLDGVCDMLEGGGSFSLYARLSSTSPSVVEMGCFDLVGVDMAEAAGLGMEQGRQVESDIRKWIASGQELPPWRNPAQAGTAPGLVITREWRAMHRKLQGKPGR